MDQYQKVNQLAQQLKPEAVEFAQRLIRCHSLSGDEKEIADICIGEMKKIGYDEVFRDDWGNIIGIINGQQPGPTILYNGHLDHVPAGDPSFWEGYDPYGAAIDVAEVDNRDGTKKELTEVIHGRAACDLKGGFACQIYGGKLLLKLRQEGVTLKGKYVITGVCLEEPGDQVGMIQLLDDTFKKLGWDYDGLISSESTSLDISLGHRGRVEPIVTVHGKMCHGSRPWDGINAVNKANKLIGIVADELPKKFPSDPDLGPASIALTNVKVSPGEMCIVPERCDIHFDRRLVPGETPESCLQELQDVINELAQNDPEFKAEVKIAEAERKFYTGKSVTVAVKKDAFKVSKDNPFVQAMADGLKAIGQEFGYRYWVGGTDLSKVVAVDRKPAIGYAPGQAQVVHTAREKIRIDYMEKSIAGYAAGFLKIMNLPKEAFHVD